MDTDWLQISVAHTSKVSGKPKIKYSLKLNSMTLAQKVHLTIVGIINLFLVVRMVTIAWNGNDKAIIVTIFGHLLLIFLNALVWVTLKLFKSNVAIVYKINTISLTVLYIPSLITASLY